LLLDCLHYRPHPTHIHFEKSLEYAAKIDARQTYLIHMTHQMEYAEASARLPANVHLGYDGLRLHLD
jgi:phosphoribosyl 1,2-cyclic phosphate phosphodiesterase